VFTATITILASANVVILWSLVGLINEKRDSGYIDEDFLNYGSSCLAVFAAIVLALLVYSYWGMRQALSRIFGKDLPPDFTYLSNHFACEVGVFGFYFLYMCAYGNFYRVICTTYIRFIVSLIL